MTKALVVVAHPDDETIWMGGFLLRYEDWDWTIVTLCRAKDEDRAPRFREICSKLKAKGYMFDLDDTEHGYFKKINHIDIENRLEDFQGQHFDYVFTHGSNGEYGHVRHKQVSEAVTGLVKEGRIKARNLYHFSYARKGKFSYANKNSDKYIKLSDRELEEKKNLIKNVYGFETGSFEEVCASGFEAFNVK